MEPVNITYRIKRGKRTDEFAVSLDPETFELLSEPPADPPAWASLDFKKCSHCPLDSAQHPHCPVALHMVDVVERFHDTKSIDEVEMEVITEERRVIQNTVLQRAIASLFELIFPSCGCPKTEHLRPLARFHLPLASEEENVFRVTGMYLLAQYFLKTVAKGGRIEFQGLIDLYEEMGVLNKAIASRLQTATHSDSVKNAIALLDMYSTLVPLLLEDELVEMRGFFKAYLPKELPEEVPAVKTNYLKSIKELSLELVPLEEEKAGDDVPDWLKQARGEAPEADAVQKPEEKKEAPAESTVDKILKGSKLSLELVPLEDEKKDKEEKPTTGRASFKLPED